MQIRLRNWPFLISLAFTLLLLVAYFVRNPTISTYGRVRLKRSCILLNNKNLSEFEIQDLIRDFGSVFDFERNECLIIKPVIDQIYEWEVASRSLLQYDQEFKLKIQHWLAKSSIYRTAESEFQRQVISTVYNKWTRTMTARNPLRSKKPTNTTIKTDRLIQSIEVQSKDCDFCRGNYAKDIPLSNQRVIVAANAFKLQDFNALFIFKQHNPLKLTYEDYAALFQLANQWFALASKSSKYGHDHPMISWDSLPPSGGSQVHGHMHGFLGRGHQLGRFRGYQDARRLYAQAYSGFDLTQDLINVHVALGLAFRVGSIAVVSPLDPICNHELMIFSPQVDDYFAEMVYLLHRTFIDELQVLSWSSAISWPTDGDLAKLVIGARSEKYPVSSMELYLFSSVTSNPYETIEAAQRSLLRMSR